MSLPNIPAVTPETVERALRAVREIVEVREGRRPNSDPLEKFLTVRDLYQIGLVSVRDASGRTTSYIGQPSLGGIVLPPPLTDPADLTIPPAPTGLVASGALANIILDWDPVTYDRPRHAYTEIWRADVDNIGQAVKIGQTPGSVYADNVGSANITKYYWVRFVSTANVVGAYNKTQGTPGVTGFVLSAHLADLLITAQKIADGAVDFLTKVGGTQKPESYATATLASNLIFNGNADKGDNRNFTGLVYQTGSGVSGSAHFKHTSTSQGELFSDEFVPINPSTRYEMETTAWTDLAGTTGLIGLQCTDKDKIEIRNEDCWRDPAKATTLFSAYVAGTLTADIVPPPQDWFTAPVPFSYIQFGYLADGSDLPKRTGRSLSRITNIDKSPGTYWRLTLEASCDTGYATGTPVGNSTSGSRYTYLLLGGTAIGPTPVRYTGQITGVNAANATPLSTQFRIGTRYVRWLALSNFNQADTTHYDEISLRPYEQITGGNISQYMANAAIGSLQVADAAIGNAAIANLAVGTAHIQNAAIVNAKIGDLAVDSAKIASLAVVTAKIADLAVTTAKIANLAVGTAQIQLAAITTALIGTAQITSAKIGTAAIQTAHIGDAQVDTLKIAGNAVTVPGSGGFESDSYLEYWHQNDVGAWNWTPISFTIDLGSNSVPVSLHWSLEHRVMRLDVPSPGSPVFDNQSNYWTVNQIQIVRDSTVLRSQSGLHNQTVSPYYAILSGAMVDNPGTGVHTYKIFWNATSSGLGFNFFVRHHMRRASLLALGTKR